LINNVDVANIGAGTAELAALHEVRRKTDNFVLINKPPYGTTCARVGCMPTKTLIAATNAFHARKLLAAFGIKGGDKHRLDRVHSVFRPIEDDRGGAFEHVIRDFHAVDPEVLKRRFTNLCVSVVEVGPVF
jgi:dihydrolipoamide dehydrogenase